MLSITTDCPLRNLKTPVLTTDSNALGLDGRKLSVARAVGALMVCDLSAWSGLAAGFV